MKLIEGHTYNRKELHETLAEGSRYGGIAVMRNARQIYLFSSDKGEEHGYRDGWDDENQNYFYTGAGQTGDQDPYSKRHNGHILSHAEDGVAINLMIETKPGHHRFECELTLVDYSFFDTHDQNGNNRRAIRFRFNRAGVVSPGEKEQRKTHIRPDKTSRQGLVTSRVGQGYYRQAVLKKFDRKCAVTGLDAEELLIASHIVPWRESNDTERLDENNSLLLSPAYDALFDKHLISFNGEGYICIASTLSAEQRTALGITGHEKIRINDDMKPYMARHLANLR
ncbi:HNH endonuclease [Litorivicinus lipolyticus]|uniref:HNH endonuclease n=1 Tax=Litorivicinus lipolyticus TaxID=418701 RepID=UPI003B5C5113